MKSSKAAATGVCIAALATLSGCVGPTPYREATPGGGRLGYSSAKVGEALYRVEFIGSARTPLLAVDAFALFRSAEIANEMGAPAFSIVEGQIDPTLLRSEEQFGQQRPYSRADFEVTALGDTREAEPVMRKVRGFSMPAPVFRAPAPTPTYRAPTYIYIPGQAYVPAQTRGVSLLVKLHSSLKDMDDRTYVTSDVLERLGPRIRRPPTI